MAKVPFGNRQAAVLANLDHARRLDLLAEGLPIILRSAEGFDEASRSLGGARREARVLEGFAEEEAAKILILIDLVRCPSKRASRTVGRIIRNFYDHLARLIYADAQSWKPMHLRQLRDYVDQARRGHSLEGYVGEHILPNWNRYSRESALYADIEVHEDGVPRWNRPHDFEGLVWEGEPLSVQLAKAMAALGMLERQGLQTVADIWGGVDFSGDEGFADNQPLIQRLFEQLDAEGLVSDMATADHARLLRTSWQMPMYDIDFRELPVTLEDLHTEREARLWSEVGGPLDYC